VGQLRFGTDGVRGRALTELTIDYVGSLGRAAAEALGRGEWLIGRDTRESGPALEQALVDGLHAAGADVTRLGVLPTPALAYLSGRHGAPAAMITASHNPYTDNGVKIFAAGGLKLTDEVEQAIETSMWALVALRHRSGGRARCVLRLPRRVDIARFPRRHEGRTRLRQWGDVRGCAESR
jgi:phosphoglucosamine mutase